MLLPHPSRAVEKLSPLSVCHRQEPAVERKGEGQEGRWIHGKPASVSQARGAGACTAWARGSHLEVAGAHKPGSIHVPVKVLLPLILSG